MSGRSIILPESVNAEIRRQAAEQPTGPSQLTREEREAFLVSLPAGFNVEAEDHLNHLADQDEKHCWEFLEGAVLTITKLLREADLGRFQKPLLTIEDAAAMLSLSPKRFENIICEERARLGRTPDFVVDAGGRIQRRVLRDELVAWAKGRSRRAGRPRIAASGIA